MSDNENNGPVTAEQGGGGDVSQVTKMKDDIVAEVKVNAGGDNGISEDQPEETEDKTDEGKMEVDAEETSETKDAVEPEPQKTPAKRGRKKKVVKEVDEDEESDEEDLPPGLLERPVVLDEGRKRERKKTDRLETSFTTPGSKGKVMNIPEGSGTKLGDIDNVEFQLRKVHGEDLKHLHRVLYSRAGTTTEVKKNIRKFCGFAFAKNSADYDKRVLVITKNTLAQLKLMCDTLDLERGGTKESIVERIIDFMMCPHASDRKQKGGENKPKLKRTPSGKERKRRRTKKEMEEARRLEAEDNASGKKRTNKRKAPSTDEDGEAEEEEEGESEGNVSGEEEEEEKKEESEKEQEAQKKKRAKVESPKKETKKTKEAKTKKEVAEKKTPQKKAKSSKKQKPPVEIIVQSPGKQLNVDYIDSILEDSSEESSDEETSSKKPPSDEELKEVVKKILDGANLEEITMKTVCRQVFDKYPAFDLSSRKDYIKSTVKQIIR